MLALQLAACRYSCGHSVKYVCKHMVCETNCIDEMNIARKSSGNELHQPPSDSWSSVQR